MIRAISKAMNMSWDDVAIDLSMMMVTVDATEDDAATTPTPSILVRRKASLDVTRIA